VAHLWKPQVNLAAGINFMGWGSFSQGRKHMGHWWCGQHSHYVDSYRWEQQHAFHAADRHSNELTDWQLRCIKPSFCGRSLIIVSLVQQLPVASFKNVKKWFWICQSWILHLITSCREHRWLLLDVNVNSVCCHMLRPPLLSVVSGLLITHPSQTTTLQTHTVILTAVLSSYQC